MDLDKLKKNIDTIINLKTNDNKIASAELFAFKTELSDGTNKYVQLNYEIYNTNIQKSDVVENMQFLMSSFKKRYLDKDTTFQEYSITNSKDVVDYLCRESFDFKKPEIENGTDESIDSSKYKIEHFINSINSCTNDALKKKDYRGLKYSILKMTITDLGDIYILNKCNPMYQPKGILYSFIEGSVENESEDTKNIKKPLFKKLTPLIFKLPTYPSMIIFKEYCFFISPEIESVFGFEAHNRTICSEQLEKLKGKVKLNAEAIPLLQNLSNMKSNYNLFADFDDSTLEKIINRDADTLKFINKTLQISIDNDLNCNLPDEEKVKLLLYFITNSIKKDPITSDYSFVRNSKPLVLN